MHDTKEFRNTTVDLARTPRKPHQSHCIRISVLHDNLTAFKIHIWSPNYKFSQIPSPTHSHSYYCQWQRERKTWSVWVKKLSVDVYLFHSNLWICKLLLFQFPFSRVVLGLKVCIFMYSAVNCCMGLVDLGWGIFRALNDFTLIWLFGLCLRSKVLTGCI